jgi:hypothetical protein
VAPGESAEAIHPAGVVEEELGFHVPDELCDFLGQLAAWDLYPLYEAIL